MLLGLCQKTLALSRHVAMGLNPVTSAYPKNERNQYLTSECLMLGTKWYNYDYISNDLMFGVTWSQTHVKNDR